ncbi:MAG TPA: ATP synthase F1 subunit delta [Actinomycetota bacterium]|nr:ATP synthase F1 subunit delta [Actinomycetota bacterium]
MKDARIAGYAKALFEIASTENQIDRVADELFRIARTLEAENDLRQTLTDIAIPVETKDKLLSDILGAKVSTHTLGILRFVIGQGLARDLVGIADELAALAEQESRREIAEVRSAVAMSDDQITRLGAALGKATGKDVTVKVIIDPSVIGGVLARVGDVVIDGTVRNKLQSLKEHLGVR